MAHAIPVSVSARPDLPLLSNLIADIFWVTADGDVVDHVDRCPVDDGIAMYDGPPLGAPHLRWAILIEDSGTPGAVFRSGPLRRLPGPPSDVRPTALISLFSCGRANLQLPEQAEFIASTRLAHLPPPLQFVGLELGSDDEDRFTIAVRGRLETASRLLPFVYQRAFRLEIGVDPGRPNRPVEARAQGSAVMRGANLRPFAAALDDAITVAVEDMFDHVVRGLAWLLLRDGNGPFEHATTVSVNALEIRDWQTRDGFATLTAGAVLGGLTSEPTLPVAS